MLTVVVPSYNHEAYIIDCLENVVKIKAQPLKILIIDDGSTDQTVAEVKRFMENHASADIELIEKENSGLVSSLNMGLEMAETEFFYLVASDDIPDPKGIEACVNAMLSNEELAFTVGNAEYFDGQKKLGKVYGDKHYTFFNTGVRYRKEQLFLNYPHPILLQSSIFRTSALRDIGGWDRNVTIDDYQIFIRFLIGDLESGKDFLFKPDVNCVYYRIHGFNSYKDTVRQYRMIEEVIEAYCPEKNKFKALGRTCAYHFLISLRKGDIQSGVRIFKKLKKPSMGWFFLYITSFVFKRLVRQ